MIRSARKTLTLAVLLPALFASGCTSNPVEEAVGAISPTNPTGATTSHAVVIERNSAGDSDYSGLYNTFEYKATLLNSAVRESLLQKQTEDYKWDAQKQASEREKMTQEMVTETSVFLSFFTPERKNDNLNDPKAIWRVLLDVGGRRYVGKVKRLRTLLAELQALYPYHTRWNTPYLVTFPVPVTAIENQPSALTVTGPLGSRTVNFQAMSQALRK